MREAVNAIQLHVDWRPFVGLTPDDAGTLIERVLAGVVLGAAVEAHNKNVERQNRAARSNS